MGEPRVAPAAVAAAFRAACEDELNAPKPGNVHVFAAGHGMEARDFIDSARAAAPHIAAPDARVGARILGAIEATWAAVGQNTNLGIVLLCAPLAAAALQGKGADLRAEVSRVLQGLDRRDAELAFRAISLARPAGLGAAPEHDVNAPAATTLLEAMRAAAHRDRIAFQYANGFCDVFEIGLAAIARSRARGEARPLTTLRLFVAFLAAFPDSHIQRKFGAAAAARVLAEARDFAVRLDAASDQEAAFARALEWDRSLKARGLNPGTSADLTVAALFGDCLLRILANGRKNG